MTSDRLPWNSYWITGAGSGIGRALALHLSATGRRLVLSGRRRDALEETAAMCRGYGAEVENLPVDLADEADRVRAYRHLVESAALPEAVFHNAGISQRSYAADTEFSVDKAIHEVNFVAPVHLTKLLLPHMIEENRGCIVAVSSLAGLLAAPLRSAYNAAKAAQISYFRTLRNELHDTGVLVAVALPGFVRTDVSRNALTGNGAPYGTMDPNQESGITPGDAAAAIIAGVERRKPIISTGLSIRGRVILAIERFSPSLADAILRSREVR